MVKAMLDEQVDCVLPPLRQAGLYTRSFCAGIVLERYHVAQFEPCRKRRH